MQDCVGALGEASGYGAGTDDGDGIANVADAADGDGESDLVQVHPGRLDLHSAEDLEQFAARWATACRTGAELIVQRHKSFGLWRDASRAVRKSRSARMLQPINTSLVQKHGVVHLWQWQRNANVVWHTASDCITGTGVPFRFDMEQRAQFTQFMRMTH